MPRSIIFLFLLFVQLHYLMAQKTIPREFRGVWIATVGNIDWPSSKSLSTDEQKKEITNLLDLFKSMNFNAIIFQVRPAADAFYNSKYEPWSSYLNGENGKAPMPYYDPMAYIIDETHKRGMEFHAWVNPYRAVVNYQEYRSKPFPLTYEKPDWFINYGKNKYFDPGNPKVRAYTNMVVKDIVQNYDIDALHFDDYFYPYKIPGQNFDDSRSFKAFGGQFYPKELSEWRRQNVNMIINELGHTIKTLKPWVQFGISPFGVWRNIAVDQRGSMTQAGQTNYDDLYADVLHWMKNGWIDYILPQAYWHIGHEKVDYGEIVRWWANNSFGTNLYIGHGMYRLGNKSEDMAWQVEWPTQIEQQLDMNKSLAQIKGSAFFSAKSFTHNPFDVNASIVKKYYTNPILQPLVNKEEKFTPQPVSNARVTKLKNKQYLLEWEPTPENSSNQAVKYLIYIFKDGENRDFKDKSKILDLTGETKLVLNKKTLQSGQHLVIFGVSKNNNISSPVSVRL